MALPEATIPFYVYTLEVFLIIAVSIATGRENTFANIATNGIICVMAGGTLLYDHRIVGFFLLAYGVFLMTLGTKEYEEKRAFMETGYSGKVIKIFGHYIMVSVVLLSILSVEYLGINIFAYSSILLSFLLGLVFI